MVAAAESSSHLDASVAFASAVAMCLGDSTVAEVAVGCTVGGGLLEQVVLLRLSSVSSFSTDRNRRRWHQDCNHHRQSHHHHCRHTSVDVLVHRVSLIWGREQVHLGRMASMQKTASCPSLRSLAWMQFFAWVVAVIPLHCHCRPQRTHLHRSHCHLNHHLLGSHHHSLRHHPQSHLPPQGSHLRVRRQ